MTIRAVDDHRSHLIASIYRIVDAFFLLCDSVHVMHPERPRVADCCERFKKSGCVITAPCMAILLPAESDFDVLKSVGTRQSAVFNHTILMYSYIHTRYIRFPLTNVRKTS